MTGGGHRLLGAGKGLLTPTHQPGWVGGLSRTSSQVLRTYTTALDGFSFQTGLDTLHIVSATRFHFLWLHVQVLSPLGK